MVQAAELRKGPPAAWPPQPSCQAKQRAFMDAGWNRRPALRPMALLGDPYRPILLKNSFR